MLASSFGEPLPDLGVEVGDLQAFHAACSGGSPNSKVPVEIAVGKGEWNRDRKGKLDGVF